ncbi:RNF212 isoform 8 [Pongo abelii]|uniref:Probable E3 SUMO-protein ligase RNF212 n=1 Tax=Pongo abelii TaxID=9601 RepID=A0A2J8SS78_PONAB|nr:RNF212 isoform 8 [Pongo abelii]
MANWVFCNRCFQPPHRTSCFSLTNCGHVYCDACLGKGKKNECLICKAPCRTVLLSKHTDADIQAFFMSIDSLCKKYSRETSQVRYPETMELWGILEFQEKHRKRLLAFYREKISRLEESLRKSVLQIEQLQSMRSSQQTAFSTIKSSVSTKPHGCLLPPYSSTPDRLESMEVDLSPSPIRKSEIAAGPARISVISPPQDGRMGPHLTASFCFIPWLTLSKPPVPGECVVSRGSPCFCPHWMLLLAFSSGRHGEHTNSKHFQYMLRYKGPPCFCSSRLRAPWTHSEHPLCLLCFLCQFGRK